MTSVRSATVFEGWDDEKQYAYWIGYRHAEAKQRERHWMEPLSWFATGGASIGVVGVLIDSLGGTNPETGERMLPLTFVVDSFFERLVWGIGVGATLGAVLFALALGVTVVGAVLRG